MLPNNTVKSRTKFLNLRDSVKKSPTKSTAKAGSPVQNIRTREHLLWTSVAFEKVCEGPQALGMAFEVSLLVEMIQFVDHMGVLRKALLVRVEIL